MSEIKNAYKIVIEKPERKRSLGRLRRGWEGNIKSDFKGTEYEGVKWIYLAQDRVQ
jgi:hypothetical protein